MRRSGRLRVGSWRRPEYLLFGSDAPCRGSFPAEDSDGQANGWAFSGPNPPIVEWGLIRWEFGCARQFPLRRAEPLSAAL